MYVTIVCVVLAVTACILKSIIKPKRFPPGGPILMIFCVSSRGFHLDSPHYVGPKWYPFFGSSAIVQKLTLQYGSQWKAVSHLAKEYSTDILGLKLGSEKVVVLFGERILKNDFTHQAFDGRPDTFFLRLRCLGKRLGITFTDGPLWKEHRGFTVKHLKNVGFGKTTMETEIQKELLNIIDYIDMNKSKPINPKILLAMSVMNILWKFTAGEKIKEDKLAHLLDIMARRSKAFTMSGGKLNQWPWLRHVFPELTGYNLVKKMNKEMSDIIREAIDKHKKGVVKDKDFIYLFLNEMQQGRSTFTEDQLEIICLDILIAGSQTTSSTLEFALLMALRNPTMQNKIYDEIRTVLGDDMPCWGDTSRLIYTMAFLYEIQRYFVIAPLIGPRRMLSDYILDGYLLSEGTTILMSIGDVHFDPRTWDEPDTFNPERFLNDKGELIKTEQIYPFGLGRRRCPGDSLARSFVFITFVGIMQKFRISCCNGVLPSDEPVIGLLSSARPFVADFTPRQS